MTHEFGGRRPSRSIRRRNRRVIAAYRREYVEPKSAKKAKKEEVYTPPQDKPFSYGSTSSLGGGSRPAAPSQPSYPVAQQYEIDRKARNSRGDCPNCGDFGEHKLVTCRIRDSEQTVRLRQCFTCDAKFGDFPTPVAAPSSTFESLQASRDRLFHDCPNAGCRQMNVDDYVLVCNAAGAQVKACKCPLCGKLFKPASAVDSMPPSNLVN